MRLILLFLYGLVLGQDSVSIGISQDAVNLFSGPIGGQIANVVNGMSWPEIDGSADALDYEVGGRTYFQLTGLTVTSFTMNSFTTALSNGVGHVFLKKHYNKKFKRARLQQPSAEW